MVKIVETHLEIIKDGGIVVGQFSRLSVIFIWLPFYILEKEKWKLIFFLNPHVSKYKIKSKIAFDRHITRKIHSVLHYHQDQERMTI